MNQSLLIQQVSLSDIEAVVRKVLDDRLSDLTPQRKEDAPRFLTRNEGRRDVTNHFTDSRCLDKARTDSRSTNRATCSLCPFRHNENLGRQERRR